MNGLYRTCTREPGSLAGKAMRTCESDGWSDARKRVGDYVIQEAEFQQYALRCETWPMQAEAMRRA